MLVGLALLLTGCGAGHQTALDRLHPCEIAEGPPDAFCGTTHVFENREARPGRTIDLKIVVAPALRRDAKPDPLFVFEGGPGGGAATLAAYRVPMFRRFQTDRDIVLVDQRGTGDSNPLDCAVDEPDDDDLSNDRRLPGRALSHLSREAEGRRAALHHVDRDGRHRRRPAVSRLRTINLWGGSYGTRAALVYLKRHEAAVRSVVLDGVAPTDMRLPLFMARDGQRALDRLLDDCERDAALRQAVSRAAARPSTRCGRTWPAGRACSSRIRGRASPSARRVSQRLIASIVFQALYTPEITALLPRLLTDAARGQLPGAVRAGLLA